MQNPKGWVLVIGILVILGVVGFMTIQAVQKATASILQPVVQGNVYLQTQVAGFLHPTPTVIPDPVTIIHEVRSLARLETIQYSVEKVVTAENSQGKLAFLFGDKLLFVAHGVVIAGVDLEKLTPADLKVENGVLNVHMPPAEVFTAALDNSKSYVYDRQTGVLTHGDVNLETTARQTAEDLIRQAALDDGILTEAQQNAENFLSRMFFQMGYSEVKFVEDTSPGG